MKSIFLFVTAIFLSVCSYSQTDTIRKVRITELPNSITTDPDSMYVPVVYNGVNYKARGWIFGAKNLDSVVVIKTNCVTITQYWDGGSIRTSDTAFKPSGIISGGTYTRLNDTIFRIAATNFLLNCRSYTVTEQNVVLNGNSDSSTGRIDVIGVDTTGNPFIKQGVNSPYPAPEQINPLKEIGLLTVSFPPNSDYGITNIYNVTNVNGIDSGALRTVVQVDSFTIAICNLRGECTNITRIFEAPKYVDSSRLSNDSVYHRINNAWIYQYKINPAGGGSLGTLDQTLGLGNSTDTTINFIDTLNSGNGNNFVRLYPKGYGETYGDGHRLGLYSTHGYARYPGVNSDGSPNTVFLLAGYNGGFNTRLIANTPTWGLRGETRYFLGGFPHSEFHGFSPEFLPAVGSISRRLGTWYVNNITGYSSFQSQGDNYSWYRGATDTVQFSSAINAFTIGFKTAGTFTMYIKDSVDNYFSIGKGLNSTTFGINTPSAAAASVSYMSFLSPIQVSTSSTYGTTNAAAVTSTVGNANAYGFRINQSGLSTSGFGGMSADVNTTGTYIHTYVRQLSATGTAQHWINVGNGAIGEYTISDNANGIKWRTYLKSGDADREFVIGFGTSTYDSLMKFRGTDGKIQIRTSLNVGSTAYADPSAALQVTSTTQGFLPPRMTAAQASSISSPAEGLIIYVTDTNGTFTTKGWYGFDGSTFQKLNN